MLVEYIKDDFLAKRELANYGSCAWALFWPFILLYAVMSKVKYCTALVLLYSLLVVVLMTQVTHFD